MAKKTLIEQKQQASDFVPEAPITNAGVSYNNNNVVGVIKTRTFRPLLWTLALILTLVVLTGVAYFRFHDPKIGGDNKYSGAESSAVCDELTLKYKYGSALLPMSTAEQAELSQVVKDIAANSDSRANVKCNYLTTRYLISTNETTQARKSFNDLVSRYDKDKGVTVKEERLFLDTKVLQEDIDFLEKSSKEAAMNIRGVK